MAGLKFTQWSAVGDQFSLALGHLYVRTAHPMTSQEAIAECRRGREINAPRWPIPLLTYLDDPPNEGRAFDWLCGCVDVLLDHLGKASTELKEAISWARQQAADGTDREAIEQMAWGFWNRRSPEKGEITAIAQLLFVLSRSDWSQRFDFVVGCSTPILVLEGLESRRGEVFNQVLSHFSSYVDSGETSHLYGLSCQESARRTRTKK